MHGFLDELHQSFLTLDIGHLELWNARVEAAASLLLVAFGSSNWLEEDVAASAVVFAFGRGDFRNRRRCADAGLGQLLDRVVESRSVLGLRHSQAGEANGFVGAMGFGFVFGKEIGEQHVGGIRGDQVIDFDDVCATLDDDLFERQRQIDDAVSLAVVAPEAGARVAVTIPRLITGQFESQIAPAVEVEGAPAVGVIDVPFPFLADTEPAFAFGVAQAIHKAAPIAGGSHPQSEVTRLADDRD